MIRRVLRRSLAEVWLRRDPVGYFRSKGFQISEGGSLVAATYGMLGTEPTVVTLGNREVVFLDVLFITHGGGVCVLRNEVGPMDACGRINVRGWWIHRGPGRGAARRHDRARRCRGAGSVVTRSVPDHVVVAGCPARVVATTAEYRERLRPYFHPTGGMPIGPKHDYLRKLDRSGLIERGWMSLPGDTEEGRQHAAR